MLVHRGKMYKHMQRETARQTRHSAQGSGVLACGALLPSRVPGPLDRAAHLAKGVCIAEGTATVAVACKVEAQAANALRCQCGSNLGEPHPVPQGHKAVDKEHDVLQLKDKTT